MDANNAMLSAAVLLLCAFLPVNHGAATPSPTTKPTSQTPTPVYVFSSTAKPTTTVSTAAKPTSSAATTKPITGSSSTTKPVTGSTTKTTTRPSSSAASTTDKSSAATSAKSTAKTTVDPPADGKNGAAGLARSPFAVRGFFFALTILTAISLIHSRFL